MQASKLGSVTQRRQRFVDIQFILIGGIHFLLVCDWLDVFLLNNFQH